MLRVSTGKIICLTICVLLTLSMFFTIDMTAIFLGVPVFSGHAVGYVILSIIIMLNFFYLSSVLMRFLMGGLIIGSTIVLRVMFELESVQGYVEILFSGVLGSSYTFGVILYALTSFLVCLLPLSVCVLLFRSCK